MKKLEELGISPLPWTPHGHWVDFAGGFLSTGETGSGYEVYKKAKDALWKAAGEEAK